MSVTCLGCGNSDETTIAGVVYPSVYDGVTVWQCQKCGREWDRFPHNKRIVSALNAIRTNEGNE